MNTFNFLKLIVFLLMLSCDGNKDLRMEKSNSSLGVDSGSGTSLSDTLLVVERPSTTSSDEEIIGRVTSLKESFLVSSDEKYLRTLDSITCKSDGFLTTSINGVMLELFEKRFVGVIDFLNKNPKTCLYDAITMGYSEVLTVYSGAERDSELKALKDRIIVKVDSANLSDDKVVLVNSIIKNIDPSIYD